MFVGTLEPRKGLPTLLQAYRQARLAGVELPDLLLVGRWGWNVEELQVEVELATLEGWCRVAGYVPQSALRQLYGRAEFLAFPSLYEGFGLPLLEAMHAGTPIVASDLPVTREVAGDSAIYASPGDRGSWTEALRQLHSDATLRESLSQAGIIRDQGFRWETAAQLTVEVFETAARGERP